MADAAALIVGEAGQAGARLVGQALHDDAHVAQRRRNRGAARRRVIPAARRAALGSVLLYTCMRSHGGLGATCLYPPHTIKSCPGGMDSRSAIAQASMASRETCHAYQARAPMRTDASTSQTWQTSTAVRQPGTC